MKKGITTLISLFVAIVLFAQTKPTIEWVSVPAGTFVIGSPLSEVYRNSNEDQHQVSLSSFNMSKYEITVAQFKAFVDATGYVTDADKGTGDFRGSAIWAGIQWEFKEGVNWRCDVDGRIRPNSEFNHPVIHVSWNDAVAFADWMGCRLPTEAEWEYACRAGSNTPYNTGSKLTTSQANYKDNYAYHNNAKDQYSGKTIPVGSYGPNSYGLYDMHGNVFEWCADYCDWDNANNNLVTDTYINGIFNPLCKIGSYRVLRGGSWDVGAPLCRSADRNCSTPDNRNHIFGFRLVSSK
jgi:formylglycine-generating enzyme